MNNNSSYDTFDLRRVIFKVSFISLAKTLFPSEVGPITSRGFIGDAYLAKIKEILLNDKFVTDEHVVAAGSIYDGKYYEISISHLYLHLSTEYGWSTVRTTTNSNIANWGDLSANLLDNFSESMVDPKNMGSSFVIDEAPFYICFEQDLFWIDCNFYHISLFTTILKKLFFLYPNQTDRDLVFPPHPFVLLPFLGVSFLHYTISLTQIQFDQITANSSPLTELQPIEYQLISHLVPEGEVVNLRRFGNYYLYSPNFSSSDKRKTIPVDLIMGANTTQDALLVTAYGAGKIANDVFNKLLQG